MQRLSCFASPQQSVTEAHVQLNVKEVRSNQGTQIQKWVGGTYYDYYAKWRFPALVCGQA